MKRVPEHARPIMRAQRLVRVLESATESEAFFTSDQWYDQEGMRIYKRATTRSPQISLRKAAKETGLRSPHTGATRCVHRRSSGCAATGYWLRG